MANNHIDKQAGRKNQLPAEREGRLRQEAAEREPPSLGHGPGWSR